MYSDLGSNILGLSVVFFLGSSIGYGTGWDEFIYVGMVSEGGNMASLSDSNDMRDRVELEVILKKRLGSRVK